MSVNILLATYNSDKYLRAQLDSLFIQTYQDFIVYVHDDGSTDETLFILNEYTKKYKNKIILLEDKNTGRGACLSFMWLLENTENSYYMFCDHDDVWLPNKIEITLKAMIIAESKTQGIPILVHTDLRVVNDELKEISPSFWMYEKLKQKYLSQFNYLGVCNGVTGCTLMINNIAKNIVLPIHPYAPMHDYWLALKVAQSGKIIYIDIPTILYRQHSSNMIGVRKIDISFFIRKFIYFIGVIRSQIAIYNFLKDIGYGNILKYYWYKINYFIVRNI